MEKSGFFMSEYNNGEYDREYKAEDFASYFASFVGNGVFPNPSTGLQVTATDSMDVLLPAGKAWINGYIYENTGNLSIQIAAADGVLNRIDRIALRCDFVTREIKVCVKQGIASTNPVAKDLQRDADAYELSVADIYVAAGVIAISQSAITDTRMNTELCGIVTGTIEQVDTQTLYNQIQSDLVGFKTIQEADFLNWVETIKNVLDEETAGHLQLEIEALQNPVFDDSGTVEGITSFPSYLATLVSGTSIFQFFRNLKAGLHFVLHTGQIVNNCVTDNPNLPLAAAQGKDLMDKYTQLNGDLKNLLQNKQFGKTVHLVSGYNDIIFNVSLTGYIPIGIVGFSVGTAGDVTAMVASFSSEDKSQATLRVFSNHTPYDVGVGVTILYMKTM